VKSFFVIECSIFTLKCVTCVYNSIMNSKLKPFASSVIFSIKLAVSINTKIKSVFHYFFCQFIDCISKFYSNILNKKKLSNDWVFMLLTNQKL
jgi:hypothetical protein